MARAPRADARRDPRRAPRALGRPDLLPLVTAPRGLEEVLAQELVGIGLREVQPDRGAVHFERSLEAACRACLWSRVGSRVLWPLARFPCPSSEALYEGVRRGPWSQHLLLDSTFVVDFVGGSEEIRHNVYGARVTKDAICDHFRELHGRRPSVDLKQPDLRIYVHLRDEVATVGVDLSGSALHLRGAGRTTGRAPLKETLAAGLLHLADWPGAAAAGVPFVDPLCGAGTLLTEAAGMALDLAPGLHRPRWGFEGWLGHDAAIWHRLKREALERSRAARERQVRVTGYDRDPRVVADARANARALGLEDHVVVARQDLTVLEPRWQRERLPRGLVITNPPYGERLGEEDALVELYATLGDVLRWRFTGWEAWVITGSKRLAGSIGLKAARRIPVWNGGIDCRFLRYLIRDEVPQGQPRWRRDEDDGGAGAGDGDRGEE